MAKSENTASSKTLSDAERHCCRHCDHVLVRGLKGSPLTATVIGGDASGLVLRRDVATLEDAKLLFADYDLRFEVS